MKKALTTLAIAAVGISTLGFANAAQAGVSISFSTEPTYHPRVYYPAPVVVYPSRGIYNRKVYKHHGRVVEYRYDRRDRYDDYHSRDHRRDDDCDDRDDDRYYRH
jgi:hypothetical protein